MQDLESELKAKLEDIQKLMEQEEAEAQERLEQQQAQGTLRTMLEACKRTAAETGVDVKEVLQNYVQVVTDTPSANAKSWGLIEDEVEHLLANPCIFHCLNLHFKHLLKGNKSDRKDPLAPIPEFEEVEEWTKYLEQWFTNKETPRSALLDECKLEWPSIGPRRMRKYSDTRAANAFRVWHRALRLKAVLRRAVASQKYCQWEAKISDADEKARAARIREILGSDEKFQLLSDIVKALTPAYKFLRLVDSFVPAVGKVYYKAQRLQEWYEELVDQNPVAPMYAQIKAHWDNDWDYMHCDMHSLGFCVDPEYHGHLAEMDGTVWAEFIRCATRMLKAAPASRGLSINKLEEEFSEYQNLQGSFSSAILAKAKGKPGHLWWQQWGKGTSSLQFVAMRALAQTVAASCSEQAWSEYDLIHSRRRNRLKPQYASELTRGHNQARLVRKVNKVAYKVSKFHDHTDSDDDEEEAFFSA